MRTLLLSLLCLAPSLALASSAAALRDYKAHKYEQALKDYQQLLDRQGDDPRLHFNAGAAAYRNQQLEEAAKQFDEALKSNDLKLQQQAYYNRGNARYYLGEQNPDPAKRKETWNKALQDFESSVKLAPEDRDAKFNHAFVKQRLEELEQQQQKQKPDGKPDNIQPSEEAKRAKAAADQAVQRRDYAGALDLMQKQLAKDQTTAYYNDYIQRLKEVNGVQDPTARP